MSDFTVQCPAYQRQINLDACEWHREGGHGQEPDPKCAGCLAWKHPRQRKEAENLKPIAWPWAGKEE